jgi:hypothetical protein
MIFAIDDYDLNRHLCQLAGRLQSAETRADHDNTWLGIIFAHIRLQLR